MDKAAQTDAPRRFRCHPDFILRDIGGEAILVPVGTGDSSLSNALISLNETSAFLWKFFQQPHTVEEAIEEARRFYEAPEGVIEQEVRAFAAAHYQAGFLITEGN